MREPSLNMTQRKLKGLLRGYLVNPKGKTGRFVPIAGVINVSLTLAKGEQAKITDLFPTCGRRLRTDVPERFSTGTTLRKAAAIMAA